MSYHLPKQLAVTGMLAVVFPVFANAQTTHEAHGHQHTMPGQTATATKEGPHGGTLQQSDSLQFETVVSQGGIQMFVFDRNGQSRREW